VHRSGGIHPSRVVLVHWVGLCLALSAGPMPGQCGRMTLAFLLTSLAVVVPPGTGDVPTPAAGLAHGHRADVACPPDRPLGTVPHALAAVTVLAALLHASPTAFQILKYAGVAWLLYMAWATLRDKSAITVDGTGGGPGPVGRVIVRGVLANLLNPKLSGFF